jgi:hypothetical protein
VVPSLLSGIIIGILLCHIVLCVRRKLKSRNAQRPQPNSKPTTTEVNPTYQELDLTRMNKDENNYQSLIVNAENDNVANEDDSNYTELSETRDVENNYQSLI